MFITRRSMFTGVEHIMDLNVTQEQVDKYLSGQGLVQDIFPQLTADEREFIMTGVTPNEWDKLFGEEI